MTGSPTTTARLRARTRAVDPPADLLDELGLGGFAWLEAGSGFVTRGIAAEVDADAVAEVLAGIEVDDPLAQPGTGALAVGALPFDPASRGRMLIPARVLGRSADGTSWMTEIGDVADGGAALQPSAPASRYTVAARQSRVWWHAAVGEALEAIAAGTLDKVVLAREVEVVADTEFDPPAVLRRLRAQQPGCIVYAHDGILGASPELLVRRTGSTVTSRPMAGTAPAGTEADALAALLASVKDAHEHRLVVDAVRAVLDPLSAWLTVPEPEVERFASLSHLATTISGELAIPAPDALTLARFLHPTPAVGGTPTGAALDAIRRLEPFDRGGYAGPVGWVDSNGDGAFAVALRGAEVAGNHAVLRAGAGIVAGSNPDDEWAETGAKLEPMLRALISP